MTTNVPRTEVYEAIDGERDYQDSLVDDRFEKPRIELNIAGELILLREYLRRTELAYAENPGHVPPAVLVGIRKIAGIAVRALEQNGVVKR
ncbi:hypothetical protein LCGC14_1490000 [marine sediment metagenome]|uniref:Uncharacterized protein n=1 Tax=marine sediment metagenome TaxID=412755 RepID=A0A0F9JSW8_9ZZZZ